MAPIRMHSLFHLLMLLLCIAWPATSFMEEAQASSQAHRVEAKAIARRYLEECEYAKALLLLERWVDAAPEDMEALYHLAQAHHGLGHTAEAAQAVETLQLLAPKSHWAKAALKHQTEYTAQATPVLDPVQQQKNHALIAVALGQVSPALPARLPLIAPPRAAGGGTSTQPAGIPESAFPASTAVPMASVPATPALRNGTPLPDALPLFREGLVRPGQAPGLRQHTPTPDEAPAIQPVSFPAPRPDAGSPPLVMQKQPQPPTAQELAQNMQTLQQMMMMQMMTQMAGGGGNMAGGMNPYAMMNPTSGSKTPDAFMNNLPLMMQMMQANPSMATGMNAPGGMNPQMFSQMVQSSMMNNMTQMFAPTSSSPDEDDISGFGF
jgi:hypothetical protein